MLANFSRASGPLFCFFSPLLGSLSAIRLAGFLVEAFGWWRLLSGFLVEAFGWWRLSSTAAKIAATSDAFNFVKSGRTTADGEASQEGTRRSTSSSHEFSPLILH